MTRKKLGDSLRYFTTIELARQPREAFSSAEMKTATPVAKPAETAFVSSSAGMNFCVLLNQASRNGLAAGFGEVDAQLLKVAGLVSAYIRRQAQAQGGVFDSARWHQTMQHVPLWSAVSQSFPVLSYEAVTSEPATRLAWLMVLVRLEAMLTIVLPCP